MSYPGDGKVITVSRVRPFVANFNAILKLNVNQNLVD